MNIVGNAMVIRRISKDERSKGCSIHVERNWSKNKSMGYATSKWKGDDVEPETKVQKERETR